MGCVLKHYVSMSGFFLFFLFHFRYTLYSDCHMFHFYQYHDPVPYKLNAEKET